MDSRLRGNDRVVLYVNDYTILKAIGDKKIGKFLLMVEIDAGRKMRLD